MAQSNGDDIDRSNLELIFSDYMNGEWNGNMFQDILDWHIRDRKQHELEAKISVYEKIKQESSTTGEWEECTKSQIETIVDKHIAELKAERSKL